MNDRSAILSSAEAKPPMGERAPEHRTDAERTPEKKLLIADDLSYAVDVERGEGMVYGGRFPPGLEPADWLRVAFDSTEEFGRFKEHFGLPAALDQQGWEKIIRKVVTEYAQAKRMEVGEAGIQREGPTAAPVLPAGEPSAAPQTSSATVPAGTPLEVFLTAEEQEQIARKSGGDPEKMAKLVYEHYGKKPEVVAALLQEIHRLKQEKKTPKPQ